MSEAPRILVDADACPVKEEIYKVAFRHEAPVIIVSNAHMRVPDHPLIERVVVGSGFDAADDWIAGEAGEASVVVTGDILLADRCLKAGADGHRSQRQAVHDQFDRRRHCHPRDHGRLARRGRRDRRPAAFRQGRSFALPVGPGRDPGPPQAKELTFEGALAADLAVAQPLLRRAVAMALIESWMPSRMRGSSSPARWRFSSSIWRWFSGSM